MRTTIGYVIAAHAGGAVSTATSDAKRSAAMNPSTHTDRGAAGSLDGSGTADHDLPYRFGRRPTASAPYPFSTREYARLLILRGRVRDHEFDSDIGVEQVV
jgi:hypothetical protein